VTGLGLALGLKPFRGSPEHRVLSPVAAARAAELRAVWSQYVNPVDDDGDADFEDFYEGAARLEAAIEVYGADRVWIEFPTDDSVLHNAQTGETISGTRAAAHCQMYGLRESRRRHDADLAEDRLADLYPTFSAFRRNAGRTIEPTGHDLEGRPGAELVPTVLAHAGERIVLKMLQAKHGMWFLDIAEDATRSDVYKQLMAATDWQMVSAGGRPGAFVVQSVVPMRYEYRVFIIDGQPASGAGCIPRFTPLDNEQAFDTKVEEVRGSGTVAVESEVVERLVSFAARVARELATEVHDLRNYVIDVAVDDYDRPLVVELNGLLNSGLYASDPCLVVAALKAAADLRATK
jgi:hypothetical protein